MNVVITGAARGLGAALAKRFQAARHSVIAIDHNWPEQDSPCHQQGGRRLQADLSDATEIMDLLASIRKTGSVDVVIHNAGINATGPLEQMDLSAICGVIDVNFRAPVLMTSALLGHDLIAEGGSLVFVGSLSSHLSYPGAAAYAASKDGLLSFARSLAPSIACRNISCLTVLPGPLDTEHAHRHAPINATGAGRLDPAVAAQEIYRAVQSNRETLVPGWRAKVFSALGVAAPRIAERMMRKSVFLPLRDMGSRAVQGSR